MRRQWICGVSLSTIKNRNQEPLKFRKIIMDLHCHGLFMRFLNCSTLNWGNIVQLYASIAMYVELGLPNLTSINLYMAGVRSRIAALELSNFDIFHSRSISDIKNILSSKLLKDGEISDYSRVWLDLY